MSGPLDPLSPRGEEMLESLSAWEQNDHGVVAIMRSGADELDAIQELAEGVRDQAWPDRADDTYGLLALHEATLHLPVQPADTSLVERQAAVRSAIQARKSGSKSNWIARMTTVMRGQQWTYAENTPGPLQLTIRIPWAAGSYSAAQVEALAQRITPAHIEIILAYDQGFIVGVSRVGQDAL